MLVRASRRKACPDIFRSRYFAGQLSLSCLCPSYATRQRDRRWVSIEVPTFGAGRRKRRDSNDGSLLTTRRAMATATEFSHIDDIPFVGIDMMPPFPSPSNISGGLGDPIFNSYHGHPPLNLGGSTSTADVRIRKSGASMVSGTLEEVQSVFDACLQIGRIERAGAILRKLLTSIEVSTEETITLHRRYLRHAVEDLLLNPSEASMQNLHKWFELEIRSKGVPQDMLMVAYMVKASLHSHTGQRKRLVRRYMDMLEKDSVLELLQLDVLTGHEIYLITDIYPKYNFVLNHFDPGELEDVELEGEHENLNDTPAAATRPVADVKPTEQKGLGLKSLKKSLSMFSTAPAEGIDIANASAEVRRSIQERIEADAVDSAVERWRDESLHLQKIGLNTNLQTQSLGGRMWKWQQVLAENLKEEIAKIERAEIPGCGKADEDVERCVYGPFLRILDPHKLAAITILATMGAFGSLGADKGIPLSAAIMTIAKNVEDESTFVLIKKSKRSTIWPKSSGGRKLFEDGLKKVSTSRARNNAPGKVAKYASRFLDQENQLSAMRFEWPSAVRAKIGAILLSALIEVAQVPVTLNHPKTNQPITQMQPAFNHSFNYRMGKKLGIITANKVIVSQLKREPVHGLLAKHLPMLVEPEPWTHFNKGGFISHPGKIMRIKNGDKDQRHYAEAAIDQGDMQTMFEGLNALGRTPWRINQPVFDVMLEAWNSGEAIANIPAESPKLSIPPEPEASQDPLERRRWIRAIKNVENHRGGLHSQRCFQNFQLEIARALRNQKFFFPHNIDFRGRAYPIPPYLNHMGADHCRGLLKFGDGKELGEEGLRWLKIHLANVFGFDKASLSERADFAMKNIDAITDSATNPLNGSRWWLEAADPWQCLAACIELNSALSSPDPARFVSHLPVHQDGTCNGLQHYAALGGDVWGAKQVNLEPGDRPADVYTAVAEIVKAQIAADKARGNPMALVLDGKITRKTVKQTVMTNVYGVTFTGAKAQVRKQLLAAHPNLPNEGGINTSTLSAYVATSIFTALSTMFKGAHDIQHWLGECASRISTSLTREQLLRLRSELPRLLDTKTEVTHGRHLPKLEDLTQFKSSVIWTNPVHMPIVQPYRDSKSRVIQTTLQMISLSEPHRSDPVSKRKQLQGFPPNFVHSLDATHMILSALRCEKRGLAFAAVHDSFWTHAGDVSTMNEVLRNAFIEIHRDDVIGRLNAEFSARHQNCIYLRKITPASPAYSKIYEWRAEKVKGRARGGQRWTISKGVYVDELMMEYERQELLKSTNPEDVKKGKSMVTPTSILDDMNCSIDTADTGLDLAGLGDMSPGSPVSQDLEYSSIETDSSLDDDQEVEIAAMDQLESEADASMASSDSTGTTSHGRPFKSRDSTNSNHMLIWAPLTFPPVPEKGNFDVSRLKDSAYFFS